LWDIVRVPVVSQNRDKNAFNEPKASKREDTSVKLRIVTENFELVLIKDSSKFSINKLINGRIIVLRGGSTPL